MNSFIDIKNVSLKFRIYRDPSPTLKDTVVNILTRREKRAPLTEFFALKNINLSIHGGERLGIIGLNGAGKSTLLKMIVGIYPPQKGELHIIGRVTPMIEIGTGFDVELSGRENIYINGGILGYSRMEMKAKENSIIEFSELGDFIDLPIKYYSTGMYGRLAFSIATMADPEILVIDEIFSAGDAHFVKKATDRMMDLFINSQIVLYVSHSLNQIKDLCTQVIVLHKGEIINQGLPDEMIDFYLNKIVKN